MKSRSCLLGAKRLDGNTLRIEVFPLFLQANMRSMKKASISLAISSLVLAMVTLSGCADMTKREKNTAVGAAIGGLAGNIIGGGSLLGTAAGAAAGGVIGHQASK